MVPLPGILPEIVPEIIEILQVPTPTCSTRKKKKKKRIAQDVGSNANQDMPILPYETNSELPASSVAFLNGGGIDDQAQMAIAEDMGTGGGGGGGGGGTQIADAAGTGCS